MINRGYIVMLDTTGRAPDLDIVVGLPGSPTAPVAVAASHPGATVTTPPVGWNGGTGAYYEVRSRSIPIQKFSGQTGFVPLSRLGFRLSIVALQNSQGTGNCSNLLPMVSASATLAPAPGAGSPLVFPTGYATAFADPNYGPVIRIYNNTALAPGSVLQPALYYVSLGIAEIRDEDFTSVGRG